MGQLMKLLHYRSATLQYPSFEAFSKAIADYLDYYNNSRIQANTKWMPPSKFWTAITEVDTKKETRS